jgi:hypothetical protein
MVVARASGLGYLYWCLSTHSFWSLTMRSPFLVGLLTLAAACGGSSGGGSITAPPPVVKPKLDPWLTIRVRDLLDTTQAPGRAQWRVYAILTGADVNLHGFGRQAAFSLEDVRLNHNLTCIGVRADSVGQRLIALLAIADTTVETSRTPDAPADSVAAAWYAGSRTLPAGWMAFYQPPVDAWDSQQFQNGRGLVAQDPIKWGWDWSAKMSTTFYERDAGDTVSCNIF